jgi:hypothetical protein
MCADEQQTLIEALGPVDGAGRRGLLLVIVTVVLLLRR